MATLKHISSKNSDYTAIETYLVYQHDAFTGKPAPQKRIYGINYSALEVAVRRIQQDFDFLMRYLPKLPDDSYAKTETLKILKQHKAYMAQFEELLNDKEIA